MPALEASCSPQNLNWKDYVVYFAQIHPSFRIPELQSLAKLYRIPISFDVNTFKTCNAFFRIKLQSNEDAKRLCQRSILIKSIMELWSEGDTFDETMEALSRNRAKICQRWPSASPSFKFEIHSFGETLPHGLQRDLIHQFVSKIPAITIDMPVSLKSPDLLFHVYADFGDDVGRSFADRNAPRDPVKVMMGMCAGTGHRQIVAKYDLKKRPYLGTTSMDAELSLIMANQAMARPGSLVYDPFVGTGSFLCSCSEFGAYTLGSDLDGRQIRGTEAKGSIESNVQAYDLSKQVLGTLVFDIKQHPFKQVTFIDAIVTDPPYGVRAGAKCIAKVGPEVFINQKVDRVPKMEPYEMDQIIQDLVLFAAKWLNVGGRLVFWLPTSVAKYSRCDLPSLSCMQLVSTSVQMFGKWCRVLVTMEKVASFSPSHNTGDRTSLNPKGHDDFRKFYFEAPPVVESPSLLCIQKLQSEGIPVDSSNSEALLQSSEYYMQDTTAKTSRGKQKKMVRYEKRLKKRALRQKESQ